jgi:sialate O-acetylesterase
MIRDWRNHFGVGDFPFHIVQLAAFQPTHPDPREHNWAELREAQAETARTLANCGLAVAIDVGDAADIHPKDKKSVGERLALSALAGAYGEDVVGSGPWYRAMRVTPEGIRLQFDHVGGGLTTRGDRLTGFALAGADRRFVWADAVIDGDEVVVSSPNVPSPVAVRYAWDANPTCNLYNAAGLPAVPFRTDDWPLTTEKSL